MSEPNKENLIKKIKALKIKRTVTSNIGYFSYLNKWFNLPYFLNKDFTILRINTIDNKEFIKLCYKIYEYNISCYKNDNIFLFDFNNILQSAAEEGGGNNINVSFYEQFAYNPNRMYYFSRIVCDMELITNPMYQHKLKNKATSSHINKVIGFYYGLKLYNKYTLQEASEGIYGVISELELK